MASIYARGDVLWCRLKGLQRPGEWGSKSTRYRVGQESEARQYAAAAQRIINARTHLHMPLSFDDLPRVRPGGRGWVAHVDPSEGPAAVRWRDGDVDGRQAACFWNRERPVNGPAEERRPIDRGKLRALPDGFDLRIGNDPSTKRGWIYAIALTPESDLRRIKIGWTTNLRDRLKTYRTTNPCALVLGTWDADPHEEQRILIGIDGRIGKSEVFRVVDPWIALAKIDTALKGGEQCP